MQYQPINPSKNCFAIFAVIIIIAILSVPIQAMESAVIHYESYIYDFWGNPVPAPQAYLPMRVITNVQMGVERLSNPQDMVVLDNVAYVLDSDNNRIIEVDENWHFVRHIREFQNNGIADSFKTPQGLFVTDGGLLYIADTGNRRVVVLDQQLNLEKIILLPVEDYPGMFPDRFIFSPRKVAVDSLGRVYIIAQDLYDGIMVMDIDGSFKGFIGAPKVKVSALDLFWNSIATSEQLLRTQLYLPIEYSNITVDKQGMIYSVVAGPADDNSVKRLNPAGLDVMARGKSFNPPRGDTERQFASAESIVTRSRFVDIVNRENGMYSVLDRQRGRVFTYDNQGNLLYLFGGLGDAVGLMSRPSALGSRGDQLMVLDADGRITIFEPTEYAKLFHKAYDLYNKGYYDESAATWLELTKVNPNLDIAHSGIGRALFYDQEYEKAMVSFKNGQDRSGYSLAFTKYRQKWVTNNFAYIAWCVILCAILLAVVSKYGLVNRSKKFISGYFKELLGEEGSIEYIGIKVRKENTPKARVLKTLDSLNYARHVIFHPFDGYWDLKHERRGDIGAATVILFLTILAWVFSRQYEAFIFNTRNVAYLNIFSEAINILLPFVLWCVVNWALTTLMEGKGTLRDIYIATAFALIPIIIVFIPATVLSHLLAKAEGDLLSLLKSGALIWTIGLVFISTMITHEYSSAKAVAMSVATIAGIAIVLFISLLYVSVLNQVIGFGYKLYLELIFR